MLTGGWTAAWCEAQHRHCPLVVLGEPRGCLPGSAAVTGDACIADPLDTFAHVCARACVPVTTGCPVPRVQGCPHIEDLSGHA